MNYLLIKIALIYGRSLIKNNLSITEIAELGVCDLPKGKREGGTAQCCQLCIERENYPIVLVTMRATSSIAISCVSSVH